MKIVLNVSNEPRKNDILFFDGENWVAISKEVFFNDTNKHFKDLEYEIANLKQQLEILKIGVNRKLKEYHDVLQLLTKEGE